MRGLCRRLRYPRRMTRMLPALFLSLIVAGSSAAKATVGVGGRCSAGEAAKDSGKKAVGVEDKGPLEKKNKNDGPAEKAKDAVTN